MNDKNLRVPTSEEAREIGRKGGLASAKARRDNRTIQQIVKAITDADISTLQQFAPIARKLGLETDKSIKEVYAILCLLNSVKTANLGDLERLQKLRGEQAEITSADEQRQEKEHGDLISALRERRRDED